MKNKPLISVIVPIYKVESYLERCINSIIKQTYKNIEIILVDDGSPDKCPEICDQYAKKDKRILVIHKKNGGLSDARNAGLEVMNGEFVTFIDSDDYVEEDYVEYLYYLIKKYNAKMSICSYKAIYDSGAIITQENNKEYSLGCSKTLEKMLYQEDFNVSTWAKMYSSKLFDDIRFPKGKIFEDTLTTPRLVIKCENIAIGLISKYNYMIRCDSILTKEFNYQKLTLINAYNEIGEIVLKRYPKLKKAVTRSIVYANISTLRQIINCKPRIKEEKEILKSIRKNGIKVLFDKRANSRDKIAILLVYLGKNIFKHSWNLYCKKTGRIYG